MADKEVLIRLKAQDDASASVKSVKQQLKEAQNELNNMTAKFGLASKEAAQAAKKVADLRDTIGDAKLLADGFNPDAKFASFGTAIQGVTSGFTALQGVYGLFGENSKELEKTLLKVQSAMALSQGINGIMSAKDSFVALATVIRTNVVAAFSTLKGAIISTGIGALVVTIGVLVSKIIEYNDSLEENTEKQKEAAEAAKKLSDAYDEQAKKAEAVRNAQKGGTDELERELAMLKAKGATDKEIYDKAQQLRNEELYNLKVRLSTIAGDSEKEVQYKKQIEDKKNEIVIAQLDFERKENEKALAKKKELYEKDAKEREFWNKVRMEQTVNSFETDKKRREEQDKADADKLAKDIDNQQVQFDIYNDTAEVAKQLTDLTNTETKKRGVIRDWELEDQKMKVAAYSDLISNLSNAVGAQTAAGKALAVASATINTYQAANEALKANYGIFGPAAQVVRMLTVASVIATGLQNVKRITSTQIPGKGGGGSASVAAPLAPALQTTASVTSLDNNSINAVGDRTVRAYVVDRDVRDANARNERIERAAIIG